MNSIYSTCLRSPGWTSWCLGWGWTTSSSPPAATQWTGSWRRTWSRSWTALGIQRAQGKTGVPYLRPFMWHHRCKFLKIQIFVSNPSRAAATPVLRQTACQPASNLFARSLSYWKFNQCLLCKNGHFDDFSCSRSSTPRTSSWASIQQRQDCF